MSVIDLEEQYEAFQGTLRRLEGLISQLELWSDECTINHKKEEVRLPEYIEIRERLEEVKAELNNFIVAHKNDEAFKARLLEDEIRIKEKLEGYKETEENIHNWIREIKNIHILIAKSNILEANRSLIEAICRDEL